MITESVALNLLHIAMDVSGATHAEIVVHSDPQYVTAATVTRPGTCPPLTAMLAPSFGDQPATMADPDGVNGLTGPCGEPVRSLVVLPVTGPSAEPGWLVASASTPNSFSDDAVQKLAPCVSLLEQLLDRSAEHLRIDELGDQLRIARDQLAVSNQELEQFAYIAAHELVAPLRSVAVYAELLEGMGSPDNTALRSCITEIRQGVSLMNQQVQSLLSLSRAEADPATLEAVDLAEVVQLTQDTLTESLESADAVISVGSLPWVTGRAVPLQSVFANLFTNAVRYRDASRPLEIRVQSAPIDDGGVEVTVADTGTGVLAADAQRIFQMFERGATTQPGSGIGLALSRRIMEAFGGSMGVRPAEPHGATFWLRFPATA